MRAEGFQCSCIKKFQLYIFCKFWSSKPWFRSWIRIRNYKNAESGSTLNQCGSETLPRPKRVGIQIPPASYSPAPPSLLPTLLTNLLHLIPSVTWLGYLDVPVLWLAFYLLIIMPCLALSPPCQNKKDNLLPFFYMYDHNKTV